MGMKSTNDQPPFFGPRQPVYPQISQIVRVSGVAFEDNVYSCFITQVQSDLSLRDREEAYVTEPNGISLDTGYYDARLVGSHLGKPLFETWCC